MSFEPIRRPRRLRRTAAIRGLVRETLVPPSRLVLPIFLVEGRGKREGVAALPGVDRVSIDEAGATMERAGELGVRAFALFPKVSDEQKSADGAAALREDALICRAVAEMRRRMPEACLITDVALDPYSIHGHDGIVRDGRVVNDETVEILAQMAVLHARAGAYVVAPSDMMDGRVRAIRRALDGEGYIDTAIMSYTAKYASSFYGPFREALGSAPVAEEGVPADKSTYQMDPANAREAEMEAALDVEEGADILMVKPGLPYLDVIARLARAHPLPIAAYHVSGEYAMLRCAAERGLIDYERGLAESITCLARAGASIIFTYGALDYARWWRGENGHG